MPHAAGRQQACGMKKTIVSFIGALALLAPATGSAADRVLDLASPGTTQAATFVGVSADGSRVFIESFEQLVAEDTDSSVDVYQLAGGTPTLLSDRQKAGPDEEKPATFEHTSADGTRVVFTTDESLVGDDADSKAALYERAAGATTLLSDPPLGPDHNEAVTFEAASADGSRVIWRTGEPILNIDSDDESDLYESAGGTITILSDRQQGGQDEAEDALLAGLSDDGSRVFFTTKEAIVGTDGDASLDVYQRAAGATTLISKRTRFGADAEEQAGFGGSSKDGTRVFFETAEPLVAADDDSSTDVYERTGSNTLLRSDRFQAGADEEKPAFFDAASADGTHVFFGTTEAIVDEDGDANSADVFERVGATSTLISDRNSGADGAFDADYKGSSDDGTHVFFLTAEVITSPDGDASQDVYERAGGVTTLVTDRVQAGADAGNVAAFDGVSADGSRVF